MKISKLFRIFALLHGNQLYIGKTFSRRLSAVYHRHCRGEMVATACFAKSSKKPSLHILHSAEMQTFEAYQYIIAFIHVFKNAGYEILNCNRSIKRSGDLHTATQAIVDGLQTIDPDTLLLDSFVHNPTDADIPPETPIILPAAEVADQKLTIRVTPSEKKHYIEIGENLVLNQHDTLLYLFDKCDQTDPMFIDLEGDSYIRVLINAYRDEIEKLNSQNATLTAKLAALRESAKARETRLREECANIALYTHRYFDLMNNACTIPLEIESGIYKNYENAASYTYPKIPGVYLFRPQAVLRGRGRYSPQFILGIGADGSCLKFRYYPKHNYIGIPIPGSHFATRGSVWLILCKTASDNAQDAYGSFPLTVRFRGIEKSF